MRVIYRPGPIDLMSSLWSPTNLWGEGGFKSFLLGYNINRPHSNIWHELNKLNSLLETGIGKSATWNDIDIDENHDQKSAAKNFDEIKEVVTVAAGYGKYLDSEANLLHWAARLNKPWLISKFLLDTQHVDVMALDASGRTALEVAEAYGSKEAAALLRTDIRVSLGETIKQQKKEIANLGSQIVNLKTTVLGSLEKAQITAERHRQENIGHHEETHIENKKTHAMTLSQ